jgi:hypothetical protein
MAALFSAELTGFDLIRLNITIVLIRMNRYNLSYIEL